MTLATYEPELRPGPLEQEIEAALDAEELRNDAMLFIPVRVVQDNNK